MIYHPPIPWALVTPGTVVLCDVPRTVLANDALIDQPGLSYVCLEGWPPIRISADLLAKPVTLDESDAMINLFATGLTPERIER